MVHGKPEEAIIALIIASTTAEYILSDSKTVIWNFVKGSVFPSVLKHIDLANRQIQIILVLAHSSNPGNQAAPNFSQVSVDWAASCP